MRGCARTAAGDADGGGVSLGARTGQQAEPGRRSDRPAGERDQHGRQHAGVGRGQEKATATIPIVFGVGADPVELSFVASLNQPDGNVTGITSLNAEVTTKRLGVLRERRVVLRLSIPRRC
jgi:hypothetical protein